LNFRNLFFIIILFIFGCGEQPELKLKDPLITNNYTIDANESISYIKRKQADKYLSSYISKEGDTVFTIIIDDPNKYEQTYSILQYDITITPPLLKNIIVDHSDKKVEVLYPLANQKIIYLLTYYANQIVIYNYKKKNPIQKYYVAHMYPETQKNKLTLSNDENYLLYGSVKIDISYIYLENSIEPDLKRDSQNNTVIDSINHLVWQDDYFTLKRQYSYEEAVNYCQNKPGFNWRLPTLYDISMLIKQQSKPFTTSPFMYVQSDKEYSSVSYWIQSEDSDLKRTWTYTPESKLFDFNTHFNAYVRCVADFN